MAGTVNRGVSVAAKTPAAVRWVLSTEAVSAVYEVPSTGGEPAPSSLRSRNTPGWITSGSLSGLVGMKTGKEVGDMKI